MIRRELELTMNGDGSMNQIRVSATIGICLAQGWLPLFTGIVDQYLKGSFNVMSASFELVCFFLPVAVASLFKTKSAFQPSLSTTSPFIFLGCSLLGLILLALQIENQTTHQALAALSHITLGWSTVGLIYAWVNQIRSCFYP